MHQKGNIEVYYDDMEIIEFLHTVPPFKECNGLPILRFLELHSKGMDFSFVFQFKTMVYALYKFDLASMKPGDAGLILTSSHPAFALEQLAKWHVFKELGMDLIDERLAAIETGLVAIHGFEIFKSQRHK